MFPQEKETKIEELKAKVPSLKSSLFFSGCYVITVNQLIWSLVVHMQLQEVVAGLSSSQVELEARLHELTESLIKKQTTLEALGSERNSLRLQLERTEVTSQTPLLLRQLFYSFFLEILHSFCRASWQLQGRPRPPLPTQPSRDWTPPRQRVSSLYWLRSCYQSSIIRSHSTNDISSSPGWPHPPGQSSPQRQTSHEHC